MNKARLWLVVLITVSIAACQDQGIKTDNQNMPYNAYLAGSKDIGVVLCHGRGHHPTWMVVDPLRKGIHQQLGYHTLSIQMPIGNVGWREYVNFFPDARKRIDAAIKVLKEKGIKTVYLMGHSMGTRMATSYLAENQNSTVVGFIGVGIRTYGEGDLNTTNNLRKINLPILDVYGDGGDGKDARHAEEHADFVGPNYQQVVIPGADHRFTDSDHEKQMVAAVVKWLKAREK